jgi:hypothetical protein
MAMRTRSGSYRLYAAKASACGPVRRANREWMVDKPEVILPPAITIRFRGSRKRGFYEKVTDVNISLLFFFR